MHLPAGEIQGLGDLARQREDDLQRVQHIGLLPGVGQGVPAADRASGHRLDLGDQRQAGHLIHGLDAGLAALVDDAGWAEVRGPVAARGRVPASAVQPVAGQSWPAEPACRVLREQRALPCAVSEGGDHSWVEAARGHRADPHRGRHDVTVRRHDQAGAWRSRRIVQQERRGRRCLTRRAGINGRHAPSVR
jgi:hypothetical protein